MTDRPFETDMLPKPDDTETLGALLERERARRGWSRREVAVAVGMTYEKFQRVKADVDLPTGEELLNIGRMLDRDPIQLERHVKATVYRVMERTLHAFSHPLPTLRAARRRGPETGDAEAASVENLPVAVRRMLAAEFGVPLEDTRGIVAGLRAVAAQDAERQTLFIKGLGALVELEGEEAWTDAFEALLGDGDDAREP